MGQPRVGHYHKKRGASFPQSRLVAVGGGKGGVGKSFVSSNLAIFLSKLGYRTLIIDADWGAANVHTVLGEALPNKGFSQFLAQPSMELEDIIFPTRFANLRMISGSSDWHDVANLTDKQKTRIMSSIYNYKTDYVILDLSAGTHKTTLDFFLMAQDKVVTVTPDPSSIENAYRFIKATFFRRIKRFENQLHLGELIGGAMANPEQMGIKTPAHLVDYVRNHDEDIGQALNQVMQQLFISIVINQTRTSKEVELGESIHRLVSKYFGIPTQFLGALDYDNAVWQSLRRKKPLLLESPHSRLYAQLLGVARNLSRPQVKKAVV
jgi:flagellar biosynthesis protein FlhG